MHTEEKVKNPQLEGPSGAALVARVRSEMESAGLEPDGKEIELLALAGGLADRLSQLEYSISEHGLTSVSKSGVVHLHPAVAESRQTRAALARVLSGIQMEEDQKNPVKQQAAQTRWRAHNTANQKIRGL